MMKRLLFLVSLLSLLSWGEGVKWEFRHVLTDDHDFYRPIIVVNKSNFNVVLNGFSGLDQTLQLVYNRPMTWRRYFKVDSVVVAAKTTKTKYFGMASTQEASSRSDMVNRRPIVTGIRVSNVSVWTVFDSMKTSPFTYFRDSTNERQYNVYLMYSSLIGQFGDTIIVTDNVPTTVEEAHKDRRIKEQRERVYAGTFNVLGQRIRSNKAQQILVRKHNRELNLK